jgi:hypothetical protein
MELRLIAIVLGMSSQGPSANSRCAQSGILPREAAEFGDREVETGFATHRRWERRRRHRPDQR